jgi:hypothetical protein
MALMIRQPIAPGRAAIAKASAHVVRLRRVI